LPVSENEDLRNVIVRLGQAYSSKVWLTDADGKPLMKSFSGDIPKTLSDFRWKRVKGSRNFELYRRMKRGWQWYAIISTQFQEGQTGRLHLFFERREKEHPEGFGLGLIIIGIAVALLVLPISRYITKRVTNRRRRSFSQSHGEGQRRNRRAGPNLQPHGGQVGEDD
jgi:hypothetical protein